MLVDLHIHSKYSKRPSQWVLQKINCPESFTEPLQIYHIARRRGMSLVTITDHNSIDGALEIGHLPGTFISEEITAYFPEDGCKVHILAYDINESQHREIQKLRKNIYELTSWLTSQHICHALAHPLFSINGRLTVAHFEKLLLLFRIFEINGARNPEQNRFLQLILKNLTPEDMTRLAESHHIMPLLPEPWKKYLVAGSDDHSALTIAQTFTEVEGDASLDILMKGLRQGATKITCRPSSPRTLAHNLYSIAFQFYKNKLNLNGCVQENQLLRFLEKSLIPEGEGHVRLLPRLYSLWHYRLRAGKVHHLPHPLLELLQKETLWFMQKNPQINEGKSDKASCRPEKQWFEFVNQISNRTLCHFADPLMDQIAGADVFNLFQTIGSAGGLYALLAPYFVAFSLFSKDRRLTAEVASRFSPSTGYEKNKAEVRVAHFTDTFYEINGVALTLQQQVVTAAKYNQNLTIITCHTQPRPNQPGIENFTPIGVYELPEYPEQKIYYPPLLEMLNYCYEKGITHIHSATPGAIGLAALAIAHILKLPITATYHTAIPEYAQYLTGDNTITELTWKYILWYYAQMDTIYVPSQATGNELVKKGLNASKITLYPRGIDIQRFHPAKRNGFLKNCLKIENAVTLLYVGRISKEKNLPLLVDVFKSLISKHPDLHLILVGDGPWRSEMQQALTGLPCTFTGYLNGNDLPAVYASSDLFVFPSNTDTFGNVVLEAQASGIPVIVSNQGGPHENMQPDKTGLVVTDNNVEAWVKAIENLLENPQKRRSMGSSARKLMEARSFETAHIKSFEMYKHFRCSQAVNDL
jgi:glycosyltransferase involved in cell wall biosynthesis